MSTPLFSGPLPSTFRFGFVRGRVVYEIADTTNDADRFPEAMGAEGYVVFTPEETLSVVTTGSAPVDVIRSAYPMRLATAVDVAANSGIRQGELIDAEGFPGLWLTTGVYRVDFSLADGTVLRPIERLVVLETHTLENPLWLSQARGQVPLPGAPVVTLVVPSGFSPGDILTIGGDMKPMWVSGSGTGAAPLPHKNSHAIGGNDALSPSAIGAAKAASSASGTFWGVWSVGNGPTPTGPGPHWGIETS